MLLAHLSSIRLFQAYMLRVNEKAGHLKISRDDLKNLDGTPMLDVPLSRITVVSHTDLLGVKALWNLALHNSNANVGRAAVMLMNALHQNLSQKLRASAGSIREQYLTMCLSQLSSTLKAGADTEDSRRIVGRTIVALKTFLHGFAKK